MTLRTITSYAPPFGAATTLARLSGRTRPDVASLVGLLACAVMAVLLLVRSPSGER